MKKKSMAAIVMVVSTLVLSLAGCGERTDIVDESVVVREEGSQAGCVEGCTCTGNCICNTAASTVPEMTVTESAQEDLPEYTQVQESPEETENVQESESIPQTQEEQSGGIPNTAAQLTDGERKARREQQENFVSARDTVYVQPNSLDKTTKINQMDRQILANNAYDFSRTNIVFIGDSITEGITSAVDDNGNFVSYVTYVNSYLHFANVLNHGRGGRMFATYGGDELSLDMNFDNVTNVNSDVIVVFAGVNDFLSVTENKRFGNVEDKMSTAGYCGAVRHFMSQLQMYYGDRDIFFVMMYNTSKTVADHCVDVDRALVLNDYLEVQRQLAKEFGFQVIDLYNIGFMDCGDKESSDYYLRDGLHPKDNGNIMLGEHIAAELSLYFGRSKID